MGNSLEIRVSLLARNTVLNFVGQIIPLVVGIITIPYVVRGLGTEEFGVLSIAWVLLGYFGFFDLGLGRATTKFVAECLGRGEMDQLPKWIWTSLGFQLVFGLTGTAVVAGLVPFLVDQVLKIPPELIGDTKVSFFILAGSLPIVLATNGFRGVLEAAQRFDLVNYVRVPANTLVFLLPALGLPFGLRLPGIIFLLVLARVGAMLAFLAFCIKIYPNLRKRFSFDSRLLRPLAVFGGWITVSNVVGPLMTYMDRFFIGALLSMAAVGYYTAPYEAVTRLSVVPGSLVATLFPAFSSLGATGSSQRSEQICARSVKFLLLALGPALCLIPVFAHEILRVWLGGDFAQKSSSVLQILAIGVLLNCLSFVPLTLLQAIGRPDLTAKFHLLETPIYFILMWFLVRRFGITGAALAWSLRVAIDGALLFGASCWLKLVTLRAFVENGLVKSVLGVAVFGVMLLLSVVTGTAIGTQAVLAGFLIVLFAIASWNFVLDGGDRSFLAAAASGFVGNLGREK